MGANVSAWIRQTITDRLDAEAADAVTCPECGGAGCEWCRGTGVWRDPTPEACDAIATVVGRVAAAGAPRQTSRLSRKADYYRATARRLRADADWKRRRIAEEGGGLTPAPPAPS